MKLLSILLAALLSISAAEDRPNIVLVMADDMGWGQTGYNGHPVLKTPNLDAMAAAGLRFDRFYAGASNCSPTRATVLTGRTNERTGVANHGFALHRQEKTVATALRDAGYATGHFGKWHLNGIRGPGVPILKDNAHGPGAFGFQHWVSVTNFFDRDPILSHQGMFKEHAGDSSEIVIDLALDFIKEQKAAGKPSFSVVWFGTPHSPFRATEEDKAAFADLNQTSADHYGELVAMDRGIGTLRAKLREMGIADNTLFWFCSDNGGLPKIAPSTTGGLRGHKNSMFEGGLRVPAILEWPAKVKPRITAHPSSTMDIFPTIAAVAGLPDSAMLQPQDGISLADLFEKEPPRREKPIPFLHDGRPALIDNDWKLVKPKSKGAYQLYNLAEDKAESRDQLGEKPELAKRLIAQMESTLASITASQAGKDYPEGKITGDYPLRRFWTEIDDYKPYFDAWKKRPEYRSRIK